MIEKLPVELEPPPDLPTGKGVQVSLRISPQMLEQIEKLGQMLGFARSDAIRYLLGLGLHQSQAVRGIRDQCDILERMADLEEQAMKMAKHRGKGFRTPPRR